MSIWSRCPFNNGYLSIFLHNERLLMHYFCFRLQTSAHARALRDSMFGLKSSCGYLLYTYLFEVSKFVSSLNYVHSVKKSTGSSLYTYMFFFVFFFLLNTFDTLCILCYLRITQKEVLFNKFVTYKTMLRF